MKISGFLFLLLCLLSGCNSSTGEKETSEAQDRDDHVPITYLALGDSYTIGESVEAKIRWPVQMVERLRERGVAIENGKIVAQTGWTTGDLLQAMEQELGKEKYDLVSILIGVNNQYQGRSIEEYEEELNQIFTRAINFSAHGKTGVFVVSIPDYGVTPFGASNEEEISQEIEEFNTVFKKVADEYELDFYNITPISKRAKNEPELIAGDGLHPSGEMYRLWVEEIIDEVAAKIQKN